MGAATNNQRANNHALPLPWWAGPARWLWPALWIYTTVGSFAMIAGQAVDIQGNFNGTSNGNATTFIIGTALQAAICAVMFAPPTIAAVLTRHRNGYRWFTTADIPLAKYGRVVTA